MAHDVFISYSKNDKATADAVCHALEAGGVRCWIAPRDVSPGLSWKQSIVDAIREARTMVLIFSGDANGSPQVRREVDIAFESGHPILPFRIEDVEMNKDLYYCIAARHWLDALTDPKDAQIEELVVSVRGLVAAEPAAGSGAAETEATAAPSPAAGPPPSTAAEHGPTPPAESAEPSPVAETPPSRPSASVQPAPSQPAAARPARGGETKRLAGFLGRRAGSRVMIGVVGVAAFLLVRAVVGGPSASDLTEQGVAAYDAKDYAAALPFLVQATEKDDPEAQYTLGRMYFNGYGVVQDVERSHELFRASADQGHPGGQSGMGYLYLTGQAVELDDDEAVRWYRLAAEQGFAAAQASLGYMYQTGRGVAADTAETVRLYQAAADQGYARAQFALGTMYQYGRGVDEDAEEAVRLYLLAAEQENASAQLNLGWMYGQGEGVERNYSEEVKWYTLAAAQGDTTARNNLEILRNRDWAASPLMPGAWTALEGDERTGELDRFAGGDLSTRLEGWDPGRVRTLPVTFYDDAALYEIELRRGDERGVFTYLRTGDRTTAIDGKSPQIHALNNDGLLRIGSIQQGIWYLRFYVGALAGEGKRFQIVEEVDDLLWIDPSSNDDARDSVAGKLRLLDIFEDDGDWIGSGTVVYGSGVFDADLEVLATGMVNMLNDTPIATDLPIHVESFDENGVRTRAAVEEGEAGG
jgi:TPR repeat protein